MKAAEDLPPKAQQQLDRLTQNLVGFVDTQIKLLQLEAKNELANTIAISVVLMGMAMMAGMVLLMLSMALAWAIGQWAGQPTAGFLAVAALDALLLLALVKATRQVKAAVGTLIDRQFKRLGQGASPLDDDETADA
jgi:uncharacterized membrane protein YqjE